MSKANALTGHTPGPWSYEEEPTTGSAFLVTDPYGDTCRVLGHDARALANARLIAAAPEMLSEHKRNAVLDVELIGREGRLAEVLQAIVGDARAIIAKATTA